MPNPSQVRDERITKLHKEFNGTDVTTIDPILQKALELFPYVREAKARDYAEAVLRMLKTKKKETKT